VTAVTIGTIGGPSAVIALAGVRLVVDPTFDEPQTYDMVADAS
jgi:hypothetical protein